ncbi:MAG: quinone oxidoreductase [Gammaproteobacteria bacterium]|nr:quinone oxidoreductase [Gammaproteobacteria bacterium]MBV9725980.1 quinone oxidoreductase [Gammaproteobacteria bacterium]
MPQAIRIYENGGPEVLRLEEVEPGKPAPGEVQIRQTAIGVNYIDVYDRTGLYPVTLPSGLGREAAGVVSALGRGVRGLRVGERVAYVFPSSGAYCEVRNVPAERVVRVPKSISDEQAAALMLKGLTAQFLIRRTYRVARGDTILVHAAAGGVGLILCQWAKALGAAVIGVVGSEAKAELARKHGCRHVLISGRDELVPSVRKLTRDVGVAAVYDAVGKDTFMESLDCLRRRGIMVTFGNASGPPPAISPLELSKRGSLFLTRPTLFHYIATRPELEAAARELFAAVRAKNVRIVIGQRYPLSRAADAHRDLEGRGTTGSTVLVPEGA